MNLKKEEQLLIDVFKNIVQEGNTSRIEQHFKDIDYKYFCDLLYSHKLILSYYKHIINFIPRENKPLFDEMYNKYIVEIDTYINHLKDIIELARNNGCHFLIEKGLSLAKYIYGNIYERNPGDLDIMLEEKDTLNFVNLLIDKLDYKCFSLDLIGIGSEEQFILSTPITEFQLHKEFAEISLVKELESGLCISIDVKRGSSAILIKYMGEFFNNRQKIIINDLEIETYNLHYTLVQLLANTFSNVRPIFMWSKVKLRDYLDICLFIKKYEKEIDWEKIHSICCRMNLNKKVQIILDNVNQIIPEFINNQIISLFRDVSNEKDIISFAYDIKYNKPFLEMLFDYKSYLNGFAFSIKQKYYYQNNVFDEIKTHKSVKNDLINMYSDQNIGTYCFDKDESEQIMITFDFLKSEIDLQSDYRIAIFLLDDNTNYNNLENILSLYNIIIFQFNILNDTKECVLNNNPINYEFANNLEMINLKIMIPINSLLTSFGSHKKLVYRLFVSKRFEDKQFRMIVKKFDLLSYDCTLGIVEF